MATSAWVVTCYELALGEVASCCFKIRQHSTTETVLRIYMPLK